ncbi:MAG: hypothetical protein PHF25_03320 [Candidatus Margulisbacteria bacterium]|nr:hypothetical protein [Candidatus Margulisiibacteriota bacterium]
MLLKVNPENQKMKKITGKKLSELIDIKNLNTKENQVERYFQKILYNHFDELFSNGNLLKIFESRRGPEEPDLLAIDSKGKLYIFELKIWESNDENILQALRYGQIFGQHNYDDLDKRYRTEHMNQTLENAFIQQFGKKIDVDIKKEEINAKQVFVIITNGIDVKTRQAINYWSNYGLEVKAWLYRVYPPMDDSKQFLLEMNPFNIEDDPFEDVSDDCYILNTNYRNSPKDDERMIERQEAAAFFEPWKYKIEKIKPGSKVFLYRSGVGIVAFGTTSGKVQKKKYHNEEEYINEDYSVKLNFFTLVNPAISASKIKEITGNNYRFIGTLFSITKDSAEKIIEAINNKDYGE